MNGATVCTSYRPYWLQPVRLSLDWYVIYVINKDRITGFHVKKWISCKQRLLLEGKTMVRMLFGTQLYSDSVIYLKGKFIWIRRPSFIISGSLPCFSPWTYIPIKPSITGVAGSLLDENTFLPAISRLGVLLNAYTILHGNDYNLKPLCIWDSVIYSLFNF